jgi:predicted anti-sigma-YlaC factor YlaD
VTCEQVREAAAVRLLTGGAPDPEVETHLAGCELCRADLARLAALPGLLAGAASQVALLDEPPPGEAMLERLLAAAAAERRRRRSRFRLVAAASVAALALVAVPTTIVLATRSDGVGTVQADKIRASASDPASGVSGQVTLARSSWGSAVNLKVTGVQAGTSCTVVVVTKDGTRQTAATWWAQEYPGPASVDGTVAADVPAIDHVELVDTASGRVLLSLPTRV